MQYPPSSPLYQGGSGWCHYACPVHSQMVKPCHAAQDCTVDATAKLMHHSSACRGMLQHRTSADEALSSPCAQLLSSGLLQSMLCRAAALVQEPSSCSTRQKALYCFNNCKVSKHHCMQLQSQNVIQNQFTTACCYSDLTDKRPPSVSCSSPLPSPCWLLSLACWLPPAASA